MRALLVLLTMTAVGLAPQMQESVLAGSLSSVDTRGFGERCVVLSNEEKKKKKKKKQGSDSELDEEPECD